MRKSMSSKKSKVPKLTEAEYTAYINSLKEGEEGNLAAPMSAANAESVPPTSKKA